MSSTQVVVYVDGGNVQEIYSNDANVEAVIIDYDDLRAEDKDSEERDKILKDATNGMHSIH